MVELFLIVKYSLVTMSLHVGKYSSYNLIQVCRIPYRTLQ